MRHEDIESRIKENAKMVKVPQNLEPQNIAVTLKEQKVMQSVKAKRRNTGLRFAAGATAFAVVATTGIFAAKNAGMFDSDSLKDDNFSVSYTEDGDKVVGQKSSYGEIYETLESAKDKVYGKNNNGNSIFDLFNGIFGGVAKDEAENDMILEDTVTGDFFEDGAMDTDTEEAPETENNAGSSADKDYSDTITQVEGVDEADIIKTNGEDIFYIANGVLYQISVENGIFGEKSELYTIDDGSNEQISDMFLYNNSVVLISYEVEYSDYYEIYDYDIVYVESNIGDTTVRIFDIENDAEFTYTQSGRYITARMIDETLLLVTSDTSMRLNRIDEDDKSTFLPSYYCNGEEDYVAPEDIIVTEDITQLTYCVTAAIDITSPEAPTAIKAFAGSTGDVYCSTENLYVTGYIYDSETCQPYTNITRLDIADNLEIAAQGTVVGTVLNQYSMDEYDGYFRIATQFYDYNTYEEENGVFVFDLDLNKVGELEGLGMGETIRSVRFENHMAYVVTFMQTDPLYAIDLSDPANPLMLDEFKVSGYSTYLHRYKDNLMFSFGVEADEETGWTNGIKMMMYDTSDPENLVLLDSYVWENVDSSEWDGIVETYSYNYYDSDAVYDEKALYIDSERNLIGIPMFNSIAEKNYYYNATENETITEEYLCQYYLVSFENGEFVEKYTYSTDTYDLYGKYYSCFNRSVRIENYLYILGADHFISVSLNDMALVDTLENLSE